MRVVCLAQIANSGHAPHIGRGETLDRETRFLHALNYCMCCRVRRRTAAIYIGWLLHRTRGGIVAGTLFDIAGVISLGRVELGYATFGNIGGCRDSSSG